MHVCCMDDSKFNGAWVYFDIATFDVHVLYFSSKGDYDSAIAQYIRTIGKLEPSYVIRKVYNSKCL